MLLFWELDRFATKIINDAPSVHQNYLQHDFVFFPSNIDSLPWYSLVSQSSRLCQDSMLGKLKLIDWSTVYLKVASVRFSEVKSVLQIFKLLPDSLYILSIIINATHLGLNYIWRWWKDRIIKKLWSEPGELYEITETRNIQSWDMNMKQFNQEIQSMMRRNFKILKKHWFVFYSFIFKQFLDWII